MMTRQATCEERIGEQLNGRLADFRAFDELFGISGDEPLEPDQKRAAELLELELERDTTQEDAREQALERVNEYPLGVSVERVFRVELSTGGPGDWLSVTVRDGEIAGIVYHFNDWFDHASRELSGGELEAAERFARALGIPELWEQGE